MTTLSNNRRRATLAATLCLIALFVAGAGAVATESTPTATNAQNETDLSVRNLSAPEEVQSGSNYTITAEIANQGNERVLTRVSYRIAGNVIEADSVVIPADDAEAVQFDVTEADTAGFPPGTYTHGVYADDAEATANLTLTEAEETTTPEEDTPTPEEATPTLDGTPEEETPTHEETTDEPEVTPTLEEEETPEETPTPEPSAADVSFENQTSNGTAATVESVTVPEGGFVVIHDETLIDGVVIDSMLGESDFLEAGTQENVTIRLDEPVNESQRLVAVAYRDENDNREYDFVTSNRTVDGPYTEPDSREAVNDIAFVEVEDDEDE